MTRRILRALSRRGAARWAVVAGIVASLPALLVGWFNDDFAQTLVLERAIEGYPLEPWQLYEFTPPNAPSTQMIEHGYLPWFTSPDLSMRFFRPLSSLTRALDAAVFGRAPLGSHLHSLLWFVALLGIVARLTRRVLRAPEATLATLVYALASAHAMSLAWAAARHVLVGGTFGALAILLHVEHRQRGERWLAFASLGALVLGLLSSETVLGAVVFIALYEAVARSGPASDRARAAAPAVALTLGYLAFYATQGYGAHHSGTYLSPFADPLAYAGAAVARVPVLLGESLGAVPSEVWGSSEAIQPILVGWGLALTALVVGVIRWRRPRHARWRRELWLLASTALSLAPVVGGFLGGRLLVLASIGGASLLGIALVRALAIAGEPGAGRWLARAAFTALVVLHFGLAPLGRLGLEAAFEQLSRLEREHVTGVDLGPCGEAPLLYSVTGADPSNSMYLGAGFMFYAPDAMAGRERFRALSMTPSDQRFVRVGERSFTLEVVGPRAPSALESVHRDAPLAVGDVVSAGELTIHVTDSGPTGWRAARFDVARDLDDVCFASWGEDGLRVWRAPAIGEAIELPHVPGVMNM